MGSAVNEMTDEDVMKSREMTDEQVTTLPDLSTVQQAVSHNVQRISLTEATDFPDALAAGLGMSSMSLMLRKPEYGLSATPTRAQRLAYQSGQLLGDLPAMVIGAALGGAAGAETGPGALITAGGGAFALPAAIRAASMDAYEKGTPTTWNDIWSRSMGILWDTTKAWITGAATAGAGGVTKSILPAASPAIVNAVAPTAAELTTMVTVGSTLEGHLPTQQDFEDGAIILFGLKGAVTGSGYLRQLYKTHGVPPSQVVKDASASPEIWQDVVEQNTQNIYKGQAENGNNPVTKARPGPMPEAGTVEGDLARSAGFWEGPKPMDIEFTDAAPTKAERATEFLNGRTWYPSAGAMDIRETPSPTEAAPAVKQRPTERQQEQAPRLSEDQAVNAFAYMKQPFERVPQMPNEPTLPTHPNYNYIDTPEQVKESLSRISNLYEAQIQEQRRGTVDWKQTFDESAKTLADLVGGTPEEVVKFIEREPGTASGAAELYARKNLAVGAAEDLMRQRALLIEKGPNASGVDVANFLVQVEKTGQMASSFLGARAEAGRALNILKATKRGGQTLKAVNDIIEAYGGPGRVEELITALGEYTDPKQLLKFSQDAAKATTYEKVIEAWKAGLVTGLRTHEVNLLSTGIFTALRVPIQTIASVFGTMREGPDKIELSEGPALAIGMLKGAITGARVAWGMIKSGEPPEGTPKAEHFRPAIEGKLGEVVRFPFRVLGAEDAYFKELNQTGYAYSLASRQASQEGLNFGTQAFNERLVDIAGNPTPEMKAQIDAAKDRFTFNAQLGPKGRSFQNWVRTSQLEWLFPFIRTPGNIFKETARMTPGLNLLVSEWRTDFEKGGAAKDLAIAEVTVGTAMMSAVVAATMAGNITGGGTPEKGQRSTQRAAGWKPYAFKIGDAYYDGYLRMAPVGPIMGLAADSAEFWNYMTQDEHDRWARMLAYAFAQNVTNQTFMRGFTELVNAVQDPERYGENYLEAIAGTAVPGFSAQLSQETDPYVREVHGMVEAMRARIPYMREGLMPKRDIFGEPIKNPDYLWLGSPFSVSHTSTDKVRTEAARVGFATPVIPKKIDVLPGMNVGALDKIELTPDQRDVFASESGKIAHRMIEPFVNSPGWERIPDIYKRQAYQNAFMVARQATQAAFVLTPEERKDAVIKATERFRNELQKTQ